jgi:carbon-monoxide dehydrogenase medium subunit
MLMEFDYYAPKSIDEAVEVLSTYHCDARIVAGGTDLMVAMKDGLLKPKAVIDVKGIPELCKLEYRQGEGLTIGATVILSRILGMPEVKDKYFVLWDAVRQLGDGIIKNRATLIGNICNASPGADGAAPLLILEAVVNVVGKNGRRSITIEKFFAGVKKTTLNPDEIVVSLQVPEPPPGSKGRYLKATRVWSEDLALAAVAALVAGEADIRLAYSCLAPTPIRIKEAEEVFKKPGPLGEKIVRASNSAAQMVSPISDVRAGAEYRVNLVRVLTRRVLESLLGVTVHATT